MEKTKVIKFYSNGCGPCRSYAPEWNKVVSENESSIEFEEVNVDKDTTGLAAKYKIKSIPTTVLLSKSGKKEKVGFMNEIQLKSFILNA